MYIGVIGENMSLLLVIPLWLMTSIAAFAHSIATYKYDIIGSKTLISSISGGSYKRQQAGQLCNS